LKKSLSLIVLISILSSCSDPFPTGDFTCTCVKTGRFTDVIDTTIVTQYNGVTREAADYNCQHSKLDLGAADLDVIIECSVE